MNANLNNVYFDYDRLYFNKWEMYKLLAPYKFPFSIPYTSYFSIQALNQFVSTNEPFFIKPVDAWAGKNISLVIPESNGAFKLKYPNGTSNFIPTSQLLTQTIMMQYQQTHAIIQRQAPLTTFNSKPFDIRVHLQRDENGYWLYAGDLIRTGGTDAIVSNLFSNGGGVVETEVVLQQLFRPYKVQTITGNLASSAFAISSLLDNYYPFIDIGADFGVDHQGGLWLIEVNTNDRIGSPGYNLFKKLPNKKIYKQMVAIDKRRKKVWKK